MSDDEADPELLELLRQSLGISKQNEHYISDETGVLKDAEHIYHNAVDVSIDMYGTKDAAAEIYNAMQRKSYSTESWSQVELHPKASEGFSEIDIVNFIFTMDLLNFSFWSDLPSEERFQVEYRGRRWTGYNSLLACLRRALDEGVPITTPRFWRTSPCLDQVLAHVFRSATDEPMPMLQERIATLREASDVLYESFGSDSDDEDASQGAGEDTTLAESARNQAEMQSSFHHAVDDFSNFDEGSAYMDSLRRDIDGLEVSASRSNGTADQATGTTDQPDEAAEPENTGDTASLQENEPLASTYNRTTSEYHPLESFAPAQYQVLPFQSNTTSIAAPYSTQSRTDHAVVRLIKEADGSAGKLVNLLTHHFSCFRDESRYDGKKVRLLKRAQIFVADLWAALNGSGLGHFHDIDHLTMFADYRVPQCLHSLGILTYSPPVDYCVRSLRRIEPGHSWEVQLRGCSIWAVELIRREILKQHPNAENVNAVLIDFFLYDLAKEQEAKGVPSTIPHHRTRSIWY